MKQRFHTIIKSETNGMFVGWVEEIPGALTHGRSLEECRHKLGDSLQLLIDTHRDQARLALDASCIQEAIELDVLDLRTTEERTQPEPKYGPPQNHA